MFINPLFRTEFQSVFPLPIFQFSLAAFNGSSSSSRRDRKMACAATVLQHTNSGIFLLLPLESEMYNISHLPGNLKLLLVPLETEKSNTVKRE